MLNSGAKGQCRQAGAALNKAKNSAQLLRLQVQQSVWTTVRDVQPLSTKHRAGNGLVRPIGRLHG